MMGKPIYSGFIMSTVMFILFVLLSTVAYGTPYLTDSNIHDAVVDYIENGDRTFGLISEWDTSRVTSMYELFYDRDTFNDDLSGWDVSNVTDMEGMFSWASAFNGDISVWDVSNVMTMANMFYEAPTFDQDVSGWDVSNVSNMEYMFSNDKAFNSDVTAWDVSKVTTMYAMFSQATSFNQDISGWDVSNVISMAGMFRKVSSFNFDISGWDVSNVTRMGQMFYDATSFNQDISEWDVSKVTSMVQMFYQATSFKQQLCWDISHVTNKSEMFYGSPGSISCKFHIEYTPNSPIDKQWCIQPSTSGEESLLKIRRCKNNVDAQKWTMDNEQKIINVATGLCIKKIKKFPKMATCVDGNKYFMWEHSAITNSLLPMSNGMKVETIDGEVVYGERLKLLPRVNTGEGQTWSFNYDGGYD